MGTNNKTDVLEVMVKGKERADIGDRMKEAIDAAGYGDNLAAFGRLFGVSRTTAHNWYRGKYVPDCIHIFYIETYTGYRARWLALGDGPKLVRKPKDAKTPPVSQDDIEAMADDEILDLMYLAAEVSRRRRDRAE